MMNDIEQQIQTSISVKQLVLADTALLSQIETLIQACLTSLRAGGKIIFCGNGGSFADAQHLSAEFTARFMINRDPLASLALGTNSSAISAIGNDYGYDHVFSRELQGIAQAQDIFIPISTSGNSINIIAAVEVANAKGISTFALTGQTGGKLKTLCECLCMPSTDTAKIQECHIMIGHILCGLVESTYFSTK